MIDARRLPGPARPIGRTPGLPISIVYTTARPEPRLDWLIDGLESQAEPGDDLELVVVDALGRSLDEIGFRPAAPISRAITTTPKPSPWQGTQRVTTRDFFAASSARNTGIVLCGRDRVAFLDDRCRLGSRWLSVVRRWSARLMSASCVLVGAYDKIDGGRRERDHRLARQPRGQARCGGGWLYGGNFAAPMPWLLEVNGFEEGMDGAGGEDCVLGHMLANRGRPLEFSAEMFLVKERPSGTHHELHGLASGHRGNARARAALARFGRRARTERTPDLQRLRAELAAGGVFPDVDPDSPHLDWFSGESLREIS